MSDRALQADRAKALRLVPVSRETFERLDVFAELLLRWQRAVQLVAASTIPYLWTRHIADSLQLLTFAPDAKTWVDLGSGGGFPGLMIAIALKEKPGAMVHLVESDQRKAAFLREAIRTTKAPATVHAARIESVAEQLAPDMEVVTARALAPMPRLIETSLPFFNEKAVGLFLKGQHVDNELTEATKSWNIDWTVMPSRTDAHGKIVVIERVSPRPDKSAASEPGIRP